MLATQTYSPLEEPKDSTFWSTSRNHKLNIKLADSTKDVAHDKLLNLLRQITEATNYIIALFFIMFNFPLF